MIELTSAHGDIWGGCMSKLIFVVSEIMKNSQFEENTRQSALEILNTLAENMAGILRRNESDLKTHLFPALAYMMTEVPHADDLEAWLEEKDEELQSKKDP